MEDVYFYFISLCKTIYVVFSIGLYIYVVGVCNEPSNGFLSLLVYTCTVHLPHLFTSNS